MVKSAVSVEVLGVPQLKKFMREKQLSTKESMSEGIRKATLHVHGQVKTSIAHGTNAPVTVDTGRFLNSVDFAKIGESEAKVFTDLSYAKYLEYGTSKMTARPHFRNTKAKEQHKVREIINREVVNGIKKGVRIVKRFF